MIKVTIQGKDPTAIMEIVREMREQGFIQGRDFDFNYHPPSYNNDGWSAVTPKYTVFTFYEDKLATMFALKWS